MSDAGDVGEPAPNSRWDGPASSGPSQRPQAVADIKDDIRQTQLGGATRRSLRRLLDGVIGPQTKQAFMKFQQDFGLEQTATLDGSTMGHDVWQYRNERWR
jgi:peptidoglycan hydrolase-like protein with peptidoglycan-binding domain